MDYKNRGFTLVEMLIVAPIVILVIGIFISAIISMTGAVLVSRGANALSFSINDAMTRIDQDVKASGGFLAYSFTPLAGQGFNNTNLDTTYFQNASVANGNMLILNSYATDQNPLTPTRNVINLMNAPFGCSSPSVNQNAKLMTNTVYFIKNINSVNTLWRRVLMPANYNNTTTTVCTPPPWQKPTCAVGVVSANCVANDQELVDGITGMTINYYDSSRNLISDASDPTKLDAVRLAALQTAASVNVSITAQKILAGRTVTQSGSIRSLGVQAPTMLTQPLNQSASAGNTATFNTAASGANMTIKWEQSYDNGTTWTTVSGGSGGTSIAYTTTATTNAMDGTLYHVIYTNSFGQAVSSPARLTVTSAAGWNSLSGLYQNSWSDYNTGYNTGRYLKTTSGVVTLSGMIKRTGTPVQGEIIAVLPVGYRPSAPLIFGIATNPNVSGRVDVYPDGRIIYIFGDLTWFSLENVHFIADSGRYSSTLINTFMNGWTNYGTNTAWGQASYIVDNIGRVNLQGLLTPGTRGDGLRIFDLPSDLLPSAYMHIPEQCNGFTGMSITYQTGYSAVLDKNLGSACFSINTMYYPAAYDAGWTGLTLQNSWAAYGTVGGVTYSPPQYRKAADGLVSLRGLIKSGTITDDTIIATLPAGYRPGLRALFATYAVGAVGRVDIDSSGNIRWKSGANAWYSLDGITFYAEL